jgi:threonine dehydrogenase-like Zn-dependent dehydrogenase
MNPQLEAYRAVRDQLPAQMRRWHLSGAGLNNLREVVVDIPTIKPDELLVRNDACGICFSDVKIVNLGANHPRLQGRNLKERPVVLGHECIVTVARVGDHLRDRFAIGQRFIVQPDVVFQGVNMSYGYVIDGGMSEYGVFGREVLDGDDGCHLIPVSDDVGYVEAALAEPWACVVAAYEYSNYRSGILDHGRLLIVDVDGKGSDSLFLERHCHRAAQVTTVTDVAGADFDDLRRHLTADVGFDDIVVLGAPSPADFARIAPALGKCGVLNLVTDWPMDGPVRIDIGRVHYDQQLYVGATSMALAGEAYTSNQRQDLRAGGVTLFLGAGGPMGQMHIQRALMLDRPPKKIVVTDNNAERMARLRERFDTMAADRGIDLVFLDQDTADPSGLGVGTDSLPFREGVGVGSHAPFDDLVSLVPSPELIVATVPYLADGGVVNIFAGLNKGIFARLDLGAMLARNQRMIGTSGSSIEILHHTLMLIESAKLRANASLAAIGGLDALRDGLGAVTEARFLGKTVIFPAVSGLPLTTLEETKETLPAVYEKLQDGHIWTREAEEALFAESVGKD